MTWPSRASHPRLIITGSRGRFNPLASSSAVALFFSSRMCQISPATIPLSMIMGASFETEFESNNGCSITRNDSILKELIIPYHFPRIIIPVSMRTRACLLNDPIHYFQGLPPARPRSLILNLVLETVVERGFRHARVRSLLLSIFW